MDKVQGYIAFHSLSIIWYALRKRTDSERRFWLKNICNILKVVSATHEQVIEAVDNTYFRDFEDCLQDECAYGAGLQYIVTCNVKDFENAKTKVCNPDEFIAIFM